MKGGIIGRSPNGQRGFSIVELLIVVMIIAIMVGVMAPTVGRYLRNYTIQSAQQQLLGEIQMARNVAIRKNVRFGVVFTILDATSYQYVIEDDQSPPKDVARALVSVRIADPAQVGPRMTLPAGLQFGPCAGVVPNASAFRLNRLGGWCNPLVGDPLCPAVDVGAMRMQNDPAGSTICIVQLTNNLSRRVIVAPGGRARAAE